VAPIVAVIAMGVPLELGHRSAEPACDGNRSRPCDGSGSKGYTAGMPLPSADNIHELLIRNAVDYAIFMLDPHGRVMSWNPGAQQIKGYAPEEIIGEHFSRFYTDEDRAAGMPENALRAGAETGRFAAEGWRVRKDGSRFWAMVVIDAIREEGSGALVGFAKITRDMTKQRRAQQEALESESRFRLLVQNVTDYAI